MKFSLSKLTILFRTVMAGTILVRHKIDNTFDDEYITDSDCEYISSNESAIDNEYAIDNNVLDEDLISEESDIPNLRDLFEPGNDD